MLKKKRDVWKLVQEKMPKLKALFIFLSVATHFLLARPFGCIIHDVAARYDEINIGDLRKLEKISIKIKRIKNDISFLKNCQTFQVFPRIVTFRLSLTNDNDTKAIRKRLLRSAIHRRIMEKKKLESESQRFTVGLGDVIYTASYSVDKNEQN